MKEFLSFFYLIYISFGVLLPELLPSSGRKSVAKHTHIIEVNRELDKDQINNKRATN
jgi:hypothetical protein